MKKLCFYLLIITLPVFGSSFANAQNLSLTETDTIVARAERLANTGKVPESMSLLRKAKKSYENLNLDKSAQYGKCLHQMGYGFFMLDSLEEGFNYTMQAAEIRKQTLGDTNDDYLMSMNNIGSYYYMVNKMDKSESVYQLILSKCLSRSQLPRRFSYFSSNAARVFMKQGKTERAGQLLDSIMLLVRRNYGDDGKTVGDAASDCANVELAFSDYCKATKYLEMALSAYEKFSEEYEKILEKLGYIYIDKDMCYDMDKAMRIANLTSEHNEHELTKPCQDITCMTKRAEYYAEIEKVKEAKSYYLEALKQDGSLLEQRKLKASYARFLSQQNMRQDAALYYKLAAADEKQLNGESAFYASSLYMAGLSYNISLMQSDAVDCLLKSAKAYENLGGDEYLRKSFKSLQSVGSAYSITRKYDDALVYYTQAKNGLRRWPQSEDYASALSDVAKTECNIGLFDSSLVHYRQALTIYENLNLTSKYTLTLQNIQYTLTKSGREEESDSMEDEVEKNLKKQTAQFLEYELENLDLYRSVWGEDGFQYACSLSSIAEMEYELGKYEDGTRHYSQFMPSIRSALAMLFSVTNADERAAIWKSVRNDFSELITNIFEFPEDKSKPDPEMCRLAYDAALLSKGILLNSSIEFMRLLEDKGDKKALDIYRQIESEMEELLMMQTSVEASDVDNQLLGKVRAKKETIARLEIDLREKCPELKGYTNYLSYTWQDVREVLEPEDLAVEMVDVGIEDEHYIVALLLAKNYEAPLAIPLCKSMKLKTWLRMPTERVFDKDNKAQEFWLALIPFFEGKKHIYFSPDAEVHTLAVEYLKIDGVPIFELYPLYRVSSTKELCLAKKKHSKPKMAVFGDIAYDAQAVNRRRDSDNLGNLDFTKNEIDSILTFYKKRASVDIYSKDRATEEAFRNLSGKGVTLLHIASHGIYNAPKRASEQEAMRGSLLAFCGYNAYSVDSVNDGKVTAEDVSRMNLRECEMVVLSACNTGLGEKGSDGVFGLQRGFKNAGVGTIVMSLRSVHDEATAKLMSFFYSELASGKSKRESLKTAMQKLRGIDQYKKAEYWASFIMLDGLD